MLIKKISDNGASARSFHLANAGALRSPDVHIGWWQHAFARFSEVAGAALHRAAPIVKNAPVIMKAGAELVASIHPGTIIPVPDFPAGFEEMVSQGFENMGSAFDATASRLEAHIAAASDAQEGNALHESSPEATAHLARDSLEVDDASSETDSTADAEDNRFSNQQPDGHTALNKTSAVNDSQDANTPFMGAASREELADVEDDRNHATGKIVGTEDVARVDGHTNEEVLLRDNPAEKATAGEALRFKDSSDAYGYETAKDATQDDKSANVDHEAAADVSSFDTDIERDKVIALDNNASESADTDPQTNGKAEMVWDKDETVDSSDAVEPPLDSEMDGDGTVDAGGRLKFTDQAKPTEAETEHASATEAIYNETADTSSTEMPSNTAANNKDIAVSEAIEENHQESAHDASIEDHSTAHEESVDVAASEGESAAVQTETSENHAAAKESMTSEEDAAANTAADQEGWQVDDMKHSTIDAKEASAAEDSSAESDPDHEVVDDSQEEMAQEESADLEDEDEDEDLDSAW